MPKMNCLIASIHVPSLQKKVIIEHR